MELGAGPKPLPAGLQREGVGCSCDAEQNLITRERKILLETTGRNFANVVGSNPHCAPKFQEDECFLYSPKQKCSYQLSRFNFQMF